MKTADDLRNYVGAGQGDDEFLTDCLAQAQALITSYTRDTQVPLPVLEGCLLQVGSELYHRRNAPSGIAQFSSMDGTPMRVSKDPMASVYLILNRYVVGGV